MSERNVFGTGVHHLILGYSIPLVLISQLGEAEAVEFIGVLVVELPQYFSERRHS
jgi:hypothetical protein